MHLMDAEPLTDLSLKQPLGPQSSDLSYVALRQSGMVVALSGGHDATRVGHVLGVRADVEMVGIDAAAPTVAAEVSNFQSVGHFATMSEHPRRHMKLSVPPSEAGRVVAGAQGPQAG